MNMQKKYYFFLSGVNNNPLGPCWRSGGLKDIPLLILYLKNN